VNHALRGHSQSAYRQYLLPALILLLVLWPLIPITFPPFVDYYSHLARAHITSNIDGFSEFYEINGTTPPNVSHDFIIRAFLRIVPIEMAGWLYLICVMVVQATGIWVLGGKLQGQQSVPLGPIIGCGILYNSMLTMGYLSYLFGLGLMLWMIWLWMRVRERSWWITLAIGSGATVLLYFTHIVVLGLYAITIFGYELQKLLRDRQKPISERRYVFIKSGLPFLLPAVLYATSPHGDMHMVHYSQNYFHGKLFAIVDTLHSGSSPVKLSLAGFGIVATLVLTLGRLRFSPDMILPIALLTLLFLVAPPAFRLQEYGFMSGVEFDQRFPLAIALLVCSSMRVDFRSFGRAVVVMVCMGAFLMIRSIDLGRDFARFDSEVQRSLRLFDSIGPRSVVAVAIDTTHPEYSWSARGRANWHVASLAALHAPIFVATTHAFRSQHTLVLKGAPFTDLYAWQKGLPIEVRNREELRDAVSRYHELSQKKCSSDRPSARSCYLLLLMPYSLTDAAETQGVIIGKTKWFLLLQISPKGTGQDGH
jgi:hypothetical protein